MHACNEAGSHWNDVIVMTFGQATARERPMQCACTEGHTPIAALRLDLRPDLSAASRPRASGGHADHVSVSRSFAAPIAGPLSLSSPVTHARAKCVERQRLLAIRRNSFTDWNGSGSVNGTDQRQY